MATDQKKVSIGVNDEYTLSESSKLRKRKKKVCAGKCPQLDYTFANRR